jgi:hypothetical protein
MAARALTKVLAWMDNGVDGSLLFNGPRRLTSESMQVF